MTDTPGHYVDPDLDLDELRTAQEERTFRRSDTDDFDAINDVQVNKLLNGED